MNVRSGQNMARDQAVDNALLDEITTHRNERATVASEVALQDVIACGIIAADAALDSYSQNQANSPCQIATRSHEKHGSCERGPHSKDLVTEIAADRTQDAFMEAARGSAPKNVKSIDA